MEVGSCCSFGACEMETCGLMKNLVEIPSVIHCCCSLASAGRAAETVDLEAPVSILTFAPYAPFITYWQQKGRFEEEGPAAQV